MCRLPNPWSECTKLPKGPAAVLGALHLGSPRGEGLARLDDRGWREALDFSYRARLLLPLYYAARESMPGWVREKTDGDVQQHAKLKVRTEELYRTLATCIRDAGVPFLALKGITHCALFGTCPGTRVQYDVDLYSPPDTVRAAEAALLQAGYVPIEGMERFPTDHLPALVRKTGFRWKGDFFAPEMSLAVELHFQFWGPAIERLEAPGTEQFWERRETRCVAGMAMPVLCPSDALGYASLHLLRHVLRGSVNAFHVYELAEILERHAENDALWSTWMQQHDPALRRLEAVGFRLAAEWFGCRLSPAAEEETERLPAKTRLWFQEYGTTPALRLYSAGKDEIWLHLSLLESRRDAWSVMRRRLLPGNLPPPAGDLTPEHEVTWRTHLARLRRWTGYSANRLQHHVVSFPRALWSGGRWWWRTRGL